MLGLGAGGADLLQVRGGGAQWGEGSYVWPKRAEREP